MISAVPDLSWEQHTFSDSTKIMTLIYRLNLEYWQMMYGWLSMGKSSVKNMIIYCSKPKTHNLFFILHHYSACITFGYSWCVGIWDYWQVNSFKSFETLLSLNESTWEVCVKDHRNLCVFNIGYSTSCRVWAWKP